MKMTCSLGQKFCFNSFRFWCPSFFSRLENGTWRYPRVWGRDVLLTVNFISWWVNWPDLLLVLIWTAVSWSIWMLSELPDLVEPDFLGLLFCVTRCSILATERNAITLWWPVPVQPWMNWVRIPCFSRTGELFSALYLSATCKNMTGKLWTSQVLTAFWNETKGRRGSFLKIQKIRCNKNIQSSSPRKTWKFRLTARKQRLRWERISGSRPMTRSKES